MTAPYAKIIATGSYLPSHVMENRDLERMIDTTEQWIFSRTGIKQRRIAAADETPCDLAEQAARRALEQGGVSADSIDLIIVATTTPEHVFPSTACLVQQRLGVADCAAFDLQAVCTGFIYALGTACQFIQAGGARRALVIATEIMSRIVNWEDRSTCILFGDGAGAVLVEGAEQPGIMATHLHADGNHWQLLYAPGGAGRTNQDDRAAWVEMQGNEVFRLAVTTLERVVDETLQASGLAKSDIDWLVPHQANIRIISALARKLELPLERVVSTLEQHGNTSAASVPLALDIALREGQIQPGQTVLLVGFGGGFTWGSVLMRV